LCYDRLNGIRNDEGWNEWLDFEQFGRGTPSALLIYQLASANPIFSIKNAGHETILSFPTASAAIRRLTAAGILQESIGERRDRLFLYAKYFGCPQS
jgi:Fic family protein